MGKVGFGTYRVDSRSTEHKAALNLAIESGITLIETGTNYTGGSSEVLVGEVLKENPLKQPKVISKCGYIQGETLAKFENGDLKVQDTVDIKEGGKYSIHPDFIEHEIQESLKRLGLKKLEAYLLHNPECLLKKSDEESELIIDSKEDFYKKIIIAFNKLEELVARGLIKSYGVSSNSFVEPKEQSDSINLDILIESAKKIKEEHSFKYIQFPMNLLEMGALERQYEGDHLIERSKFHGLKVMINRPLNSFTEQGLLRFAKYTVDEKYIDEVYADKVFNECIDSLVVKWLEVREDEGDKLFDIPLMRQIQSIWHKQNSQDAVAQVFNEYFFPLIASIWGGDLSSEESQPFYTLYEHGMEYAKLNMSNRAVQFEEQALNKGLLLEDELTLSQKAINKYIAFGVDYVLVGMRSTEYVDDMKMFFFSKEKG